MEQTNEETGFANVSVLRANIYMTGDRRIQETRPTEGQKGQDGPRWTNPTTKIHSEHKSDTDPLQRVEISHQQNSEGVEFTQLNTSIPLLAPDVTIYG